MAKNPKITQAASVLYNVIVDNEKRIQTGVLERKRLKKQIRK
jgi:hypothetical protein